MTADSATAPPSSNCAATVATAPTVATASTASTAPTAPTAATAPIAPTAPTAQPSNRDWWGSCGSESRQRIAASRTVKQAPAPTTA
jgi:hypothetical protein